MKPISRRSLMRSLAAAGALARLSGTSHGRGSSRPAERKRLSEAGWCWDGQGFNGGVNPSIFGAGEGTKWFGLRRSAYMFHPNTELDKNNWAGFEPFVDVVNLCVGNQTANFPQLQPTETWRTCS